MDQTKPFRIGELSHRTGCNIETIRYYERIGLLLRPGRRGRYRQYDDAGVSSLIFIRRARGLGFSMNDIRSLLRLAKGGGGACSKVRDLASTHLHDVRRRITELQAMEQALSATVRRCDTRKQRTCPVIEALSGRDKTIHVKAWAI